MNPGVLTLQMVDLDICKTISHDLRGCAMTARLAHDEKLDADVLYLALQVLALGNTTTSTSFYFPTTWLEMLRQSLKARWPRLCRFVRDPRMKHHWQKVPTFEKVCPHMGQGEMPSQRDCMEWLGELG